MTKLEHIPARNSVAIVAGRMSATADTPHYYSDQAAFGFQEKQCNESVRKQCVIHIRGQPQFM